MPEEHPPGLYWHCHHGVLIEFCHNYQERADFIRSEKNRSEVPTRLRLFQPVRGTLPEIVVQALQAFGQAGRAYGQTERACYQARQALNQAMMAFDQARGAQNQALQARDQANQAFDQARQAHDQAWLAHNQAEQTYSQAYDQAEQALRDNLPAIKALHALECPNCPWNGKTIFCEEA